MNQYRLIKILTVVMTLALVSLNTAKVLAENLVLAVHPFLDEEAVIKKFTPLADYLSAKTGKKIVVKVGSSYDEHIQYIGEDRVDIAYLGPASYVSLLKDYPAKPLLARLEVNGKAYFQGNIIVHKDSNIHSINDLAGKKIAFGDPKSTMSYIVPHHMLHEAGVFNGSKDKHQFLYSHNNVAFAVLSGDFDAGAVKPAVFKKFEKDGLRTVAMTPKISEHLFVTRSTLPPDFVKILRQSMLEMHKDKDGLKALKSIKGSITALVEVADSDYNNLKKIVRETEALH